MNNIVGLKKINESLIQLSCSDNKILRRISKHLEVFIEGAQYSPRYQTGIWDGKISFLDRRSMCIPFGLWLKVITFLVENQIQYVLTGTSIQELTSNHIFTDEFISEFEDKVMMKTMPFKIRDYQMGALRAALKNKKSISLLCTGAGKSLLIHYTMQLLHRTGEAKKIMVVVPNISLVGQLYNNIRDDYNYAPIVDDAYLLYGETSKEDKKAIESEHGIDRPFLITTYQSIIRKNDAWFEQFDALLIDEVHGVSSSGKSLQGISKKCFNAKYKLGYTGTLGENDADIMTTLGYVGPVTYTVKNKQLIDLGFLSAIDIKNYIVRYGEEFTAETKGLSYAAEVSKIEGNPDRNKIFKHIIDDLPVKENVLILAKHIKHMNEIEEYLTNIYNDTYIIHRIDGSVAGSTREEIREIVIANSGKCVSFDFEKFQVEINEISKITLEDESIKLAKDITIDDHINMKVLQKQYKHLIKNKLTGVKVKFISVNAVEPVLVKGRLLDFGNVKYKLPNDSLIQLTDNNKVKVSELTLESDIDYQYVKDNFLEYSGA
jgi:hypothetical protein